METIDRIRNLWFRFLNLISNIRYKKEYRFITIVGAIIIIIQWYFNWVLALIALILVVNYLTDVRYSRKYSRGIESIGLKTSGNRYPLLIYREEKEEFLKLEFSNPGFELKEIEEIKEKFGNAMGITIGEISLKKKKIVMEAYNGFFDYSDIIEWDDKYLVDGDRINIGKNVGKYVYWNYTLLPHILIAGSSGSGKSIMFKTIVYQMIKKDFEAYIFDFKYGVDFADGWEEHSELITDKKEGLEKLEYICKELERRGQLLKDSGCHTLSEYNRKSNNKLKRIVVACDEAATMLSKSKKNKELVEAMEEHLIKIAQLGRAFGIHLVLATQRPSVDYITGEIKNNIDYRLSGRGDLTLSKLVLDNGDASKLPKNISGVFVNQNGTTIKGYYIGKDIFKRR